MQHRVSRLAPTLDVLCQDFEREILQICRRNPHRRVGLAISGGVDSMALASLCRLSASNVYDMSCYKAFIVDHGMRPESTKEANCVARRIECLGITAQVLTLRWDTKEPSALPNVETLARRKRYRALGAACIEDRISKILVAHHADDQAETMFTRLITGYNGPGYRGIKSRNSIPDCYGIYGLHKSGSPDIVRAQQTRDMADDQAEPYIMESGGIELVRPLLSWSKADLIQVCKDHNTPWVEDKTNSDKTLTLRNTARYLLHHDLLPEALQTPSLQAANQRIVGRINTHDHVVDRLFREMRICLDLRTLSIRIQYPSNADELLHDGLGTVKRHDAAQRRAAMLLRRLTMLVSPQELVSLSDVELATQMTFPNLFDSDKPPTLTKTCFGGVIYQRLQAANSRAAANLGRTYTISRAPPTARERSSARVDLLEGDCLTSLAHSGTGEGWKLFDGRFWIRLMSLSTNCTVIVRFLNEQDIADISRTARSQDDSCLETLWKQLKYDIPAESRSTLPGIFLVQRRRPDDSETSPCEKLVAVPTLRWCIDGWSLGSSPVEQEMHGVPNVVNFRYKELDLGSDGNLRTCSHTVKREEYG